MNGFLVSSISKGVAVFRWVVLQSGCGSSQSEGLMFTFLPLDISYMLPPLPSETWDRSHSMLRAALAASTWRMPP